MAVVDNRSDQLPKLAFNAVISTDTTTNGAIIDTANFDRGVTFIILAPVYTDGTYTPVIEESDDSGMSGATDVTDAQLIGTEAGAVISAVSGSGANLASIGVFSNKRFLRLKIVSASTSTGATISAVVNMKAELTPALDRDWETHQ